MTHDESIPTTIGRRVVDPADLEPGAEIMVAGRRLTVAMVVPARSGYDIAPTCGAPVHHDPDTDEPIRFA